MHLLGFLSFPSFSIALSISMKLIDIDKRKPTLVFRVAPPSEVLGISPSSRLLLSSGDLPLSSGDMPTFSGIESRHNHEGW